MKVSIRVVAQAKGFQRYKYMYRPTGVISNKSFELVDVTMRDGALGRKFPYTHEQLIQYLRTLESLGIKYAEVGFINGPGKWTEGKVDSPNYDITPELNKQLHANSPLKLWSMIDSDNDRIEASHVHDNPNSLIRLTADLDKLHLLEEKMNICKQKNVPFSVNLKHTGSYELTQIQAVAEFAEAHGAQIFYIVDTSGTMVPSQVADIARQLKATLSIELGFHGHDSLGFAAANSLVAIEEGCKYIDASLCGIGAGGGNAITETFALLAKGEHCDWNKLIEAGRFLDIPSEYRQLQERIFWGFIGCNTTVKNTLIGNYSADQVARKAMEWKYGEVISRGEHTTLRQLNRPTPTIAKIAQGTGIEKLEKEIAFLQQNKSDFHHPFLADILSHQVTDEYAYYLMPYLPGPLLREYLAAEPDLTNCRAAIQQTVHHLDTLHQTKGTINSSDFSKRFYSQRLQKRWERFNSPQQTLSLDNRAVSELSSSEVSSIFSQIAQGTQLTIDGTSFDFSLNGLLETLSVRQHILDVPQNSIRLIHGDPHNGNVLLHNNDPILLDPNGFLEGGDIAYDFGKLLISYDWHDRSIMGQLAPAHITVTAEGIKITNNKTFKEEAMSVKHIALRQAVIDILKNEILPRYETSDPLLLQRMILLLYVHQFSFSPTLIKEKPEVALHVLLNAISDYMHLTEENNFNHLPQ